MTWPEASIGPAWSHHEAWLGVQQVMLLVRAWRCWQGMLVLGMARTWSLSPLLSLLAGAAGVHGGRDRGLGAAGGGGPGGLGGGGVGRGGAGGGGGGVYGVLDGHGGIEAAEWARDHLPANLARALAQGAPPPEALTQAFLRTDADFVRHASALNASAAAAAAAGRVRAAAAGGDSEDGGDAAGDGGGGIDSGCTAVVAVVAGRRLWVARQLSTIRSHSHCLFPLALRVPILTQPIRTSAANPLPHLGRQASQV
jgi:hypothetical protein